MMENEEYIKCEYTGDTDKLKSKLFELLKPEIRMDGLTIKKYKNPPQANYPNREITISFYETEK